MVQFLAEIYSALENILYRGSVKPGITDLPFGQETKAIRGKINGFGKLQCHDIT